MLQQKTLRQPAYLSGTGLHTGNRVNLAILPAPENTGIVFRRTDLEGKPEIEAKIENVVDTSRSTTLGKGNVRIHTVEHLLGALSAMEINNAYLELDTCEPPICDGSAREFIRLIQVVGIELQVASIEPIYLSSPIEFAVGDTQMMAFPHDRLKISCTSADKKGRFTQFYSLEVTPESYARELASARTFCFYEEIEGLIRGGLIKGGALENAVVIREDAILTTEPLRYADEFVRHKILDIVGDLTLLGRPLCAHLMAVKPGHGVNCEMARRILRQASSDERAMAVFMPPPSQEKPLKRSLTVEDGKGLNIDDLFQILPHRYPFLMIDRVLDVQPTRAVAQKNVTINEPYFQGHFPRKPIMPGVLQLEAIAQTAGILTMRNAENFGKLAYFMSAENVKWRKPVVPGDTVIIEVDMLRTRGKIGKAKGVCKVRDEIVSEAEVTFMISDPLE
ncbi:MAG TPA: bifunctional UDP-3-O-[3-hydroxymyristoyl] N-acetylglucosamine deacetylase/3-hydroxyacyl-ACP dehydratase [Verrucomicrobiota bacterium]|nr:bifunctional UDP-3-O-[3-hydroxymyristoyl] N-acetylglucosamine deacetylase/3-hydroxyacyl-ACP dehydratase [Verrucomicrobiota bacterium]